MPSRSIVAQNGAVGVLACGRLHVRLLIVRLSGKQWPQAIRRARSHLFVTPRSDHVSSRPNHADAAKILTKQSFWWRVQARLDFSAKGGS